MELSQWVSKTQANRQAKTIAFGEATLSAYARNIIAVSLQAQGTFGIGGSF